jgi:phage shock protein E
LKNIKSALNSFISNSHRKLLRVLSSLLLLVVCSPALSAPDISAEQLLSMEKSQRLLLDVRTVEEYTTAHIPTSVNIPLSEIETNLARLSEFKDYPIVVYCRSGKRAGKAITILEENGFTNVMHLTGDMNGWQADNRPTNQLSQ